MKINIPVYDILCDTVHTFITVTAIIFWIA